MNRKLPYGVIVGLLLVAGCAVWLQAKSIPRRSVQANLPIAMQVTTTPTVGVATATPALITVNTPTTVTVTVQITDSRLLPNGVNLLRLNSNGSSTILGVMHDDGFNGDATANDKIFSLNVNFNEPTAGQVQLQVSAAFRGFLKRSLSPPAIISVELLYSDPANGLSFVYPSSVYVSAIPAKQVYSLFATSVPNVPVLSFSLTKQPSVDPDLWFNTQIDSDHALSSSGSIERVTTDGGSVAYLVLSSPSPDYIDTHGPLPYAFVLSPDGTKVLTITGSSEGDALNTLGLSEDQADSLRLSIIESVTVR